MKWLKIGVVVLSAVGITALGIDAADTLQGSRSTLLGQVISQDGAGVCPDGMTPVPMAQSFSCVDTYEASASDECPRKNPENEFDSRKNLEDSDCGSVSEESRNPWRFITREQAQTACLRSGKRLPKAEEWFIISAGTPDTDASCNTDSGTVKVSGSYDSCVSAVGVYDTVGNVWEWTADDVINGMHNGRILPESGYVKQVDVRGIAVLTDGDPSDLFYEDYLWSSTDGAYGMLRGGFYGSKSDAGVYSVHAQTLPTAAGTAIGFRCVR